MTDPIIPCPQCRHPIKLTESLAAPLLESARRQFDQRLAEKETEFHSREQKLQQQQAELSSAREGIRRQVDELVKREKTAIAAAEEKRIKELFKNEIEQQQKKLTDLQELIQDRDARLEKATQAEADLLKLKREMDDARREMELTIEKRVSDSAKDIREQARKQVEQELSLQVKDRDAKLEEMQKLIAERDHKLEEANKAQAELERMKRSLEDARREMELTIEKRVTESSQQIHEKAKRQAEDELNLKIKERELTIADMQNKIEELKRKAEQGSQQLQGEVQELDLEEQLRARFPHDSIEPVAKGEHGGDTLQRVFNSFGKPCGSILWESKRTRTWSDGWLAKLREDQRIARSEVAVIVTQTMPKGIDSFDLVEGVWVTSRKTFLPVCLALRQSLLDLHEVRQSNEGLQTKMGMIYQYLMGTQFKQKMQAIVEAFNDMQEDLLKEKKAITKQWSKREKQLEQVLLATTGISGDLQAIAGTNILEADGIEKLALEE